MTEKVNTVDVPTTHGEIKQWFDEYAVGETPEAQAYVEATRSAIEIKDGPISPEDRSRRDAAATLAGSLAAKVEALYEGVDASIPRRISPGNILGNAVQFDPNHPEFAGHNASEEQLAAHQAIQAEATETLASQR